jgi:hypothetical protein
VRLSLLSLLVGESSLAGCRLVPCQSGPSRYWVFSSVAVGRSRVPDPSPNRSSSMCTAVYPVGSLRWIRIVERRHHFPDPPAQSVSRFLCPGDFRAALGRTRKVCAIHLRFVDHRSCRVSAWVDCFRQLDHAAHGADACWPKASFASAHSTAALFGGVWLMIADMLADSILAPVPPPVGG